MKTPGTPILINETSMRISQLQKALKTLGFPVSEEEEKSQTAGESTISPGACLTGKIEYQSG